MAESWQEATDQNLLRMRWLEIPRPHLSRGTEAVPAHLLGWKAPQSSGGGRGGDAGEGPIGVFSMQLERLSFPSNFHPSPAHLPRVQVGEDTTVGQSRLHQSSMAQHSTVCTAPLHATLKEMGIIAPFYRSSNQKGWARLVVLLSWS